MTNLNLQAAVNSWATRAMEEFSSREGISYWAFLRDPGLNPAAIPVIAVIVADGEAWAQAFVPFPPAEESTGAAVRKALGELGLL